MQLVQRGNVSKGTLVGDGHDTCAVSCVPRQTWRGEPLLCSLLDECRCQCLHILPPLSVCHLSSFSLLMIHGFITPAFIMPWSTHSGRLLVFSSTAVLCTHLVKSIQTSLRLAVKFSHFGIVSGSNTWLGVHGWQVSFLKQCHGGRMLKLVLWWEKNKTKPGAWCAISSIKAHKHYKFHP